MFLLKNATREDLVAQSGKKLFYWYVITNFDCFGTLACLLEQKSLKLYIVSLCKHNIKP